MARKTFGRDGGTITVSDGSVVEYAPVELAGNDTGSTELGNEVNEPVGTDEPAGSIGGERDNTGDDNEVADTVGATNYVDPASIGQSAPRKRGPKPGVKYGPRGARAAKPAGSSVLLTANLEKVLFNLHIMAAGLLNESELVIDEDEAKVLADAVTQVAKAYDFSKVLSEKTQAGVDLAIALTTVYGGRIMRVVKKQGGRKPIAVVQEIRANV